MTITSYLRELSEAAGVPGDERAVRKMIEDAVRDHVDEMRVDTLGNLLALKRARRDKGRPMRVMIDAHMDEVGFMIVGHTGDGGLKFRAVGSLDPRILPGKVVSVGPDRIPGVIGVKPMHLARDTSAVQQIDALVIDIGASSKEQAEDAAKVGTYAAFRTLYRSLGGGKVLGKAFDDRAGCAVLIDILQGPRLPVDVLAAFTVQEEVGLRGARAAAYALNPDAGFAIDVTPANDLPQPEGEDRSPNARLDAGPAIYVMTRGDVSDPRLVKHALEVGEKRGIPHQIRQPGAGGTDAGAINRSRAGVPAIAISTPCRYIHSPVCVLSLADLRNCADLVRESVAQMTPRVLRR
ncbi:MAG TPA: M20/M25/M40 family metallo-hydrolase [Anaerolineae bacterium]|nr:M20/M25/M40 family metallo-hydrolase [Anaerolineae bacterium]